MLQIKIIDCLVKSEFSQRFSFARSYAIALNAGQFGSRNRGAPCCYSACNRLLYAC